jgi:predicted nucleic acid-binding protein
MLDATPLGKLARRKPKAEDYARLRALTDANVEVMIPEIADYEIRRSFLLHNLHESLRQLDRLNEELIYVPLTTSTMRRAASMWADARRAGRPTAADQALDCDVILAAQAREMSAQVITENAAHLSRYGPALSWTDLPPRA